MHDTKHWPKPTERSSTESGLGQNHSGGQGIPGCDPTLLKRYETNLLKEILKITDLSNFGNELNL